MQYTLRNVPGEVDRRLRERARQRGISLNEAALQALREATGVAGDAARSGVTADRLAEVKGVWADEPWVNDYVETLQRMDEASLDGDRPS